MTGPNQDTSRSTIVPVDQLIAIERTLMEAGQFILAMQIRVVRTAVKWPDVEVRRAELLISRMLGFRAYMKNSEPKS